MTINYDLVHFHVTIIHFILLLAQRLHTYHSHGGINLRHFFDELKPKKNHHPSDAITLYGQLYCERFVCGYVNFSFLDFYHLICLCVYNTVLTLFIEILRPFHIGYRVDFNGSRKKLSCNGMVLN